GSPPLDDDTDDDPELVQNEHVERFGLRPRADSLSTIRHLLREQIALERRAQGLGNSLVMRLCCAQLFFAAIPEDILLIWDAKESSFDCGCSIDVQLLCAIGLEATQSYLRQLDHSEARSALALILECEAAGTFEGFSPDEYGRELERYYAPRRDT